MLDQAAPRISLLFVQPSFVFFPYTHTPTMHRTLSVRSRTHRSRTVAQASSQTSLQTKNSYRITVFQALKVTGPAPERINARLAMAMWPFMVLREIESSETVVQQVMHRDWRLAVAAALGVWGSMVPVLAGCRDEDFGWLSVRAEKVNGRVAMLAWAVVLFAEEVLGRGEVCFF